jgi:tellurite methyltransferase
MTKAAASIIRYSRFFRQSQADTVLDYGAGTLRNTLYLAQNGFTVYAADLPEQVEVQRRRPVARQLAGFLNVGELEKSRLGVDLVLSTYVFNIIMETDEKRRYLDNVVANLRMGGYFLIEVRCRQQETECNDSCSHHFKCASCAKTFTHEELDSVITPYGFRRLSHYYRHHAVAAIYQRTEAVSSAANQAVAGK